MEPSSRHSSNTLVSSLPASVPVDAEANAVPAALDGASSRIPSPLDSDDSNINVVNACISHCIFLFYLFMLATS